MRTRFARNAGRLRTLALQRLEERRLLAAVPERLPLPRSTVGSDSISSPSEAFATSQGVYFVANDVLHGFELWKTDGTSQGTHLLKDVAPGGESSWAPNFSPIQLPPTKAAELNGEAFFIYQQKLWKSNGTTAGTIPLGEFPAPITWPPREPFAFQNHVYFLGPNPGGGWDIWKTDGMLGGTKKFLDVNGRPAGAVIENPVVFDDHFYFLADAFSGEFKLWSSDGSIQGTQSLTPTDLRFGGVGRNPNQLTVVQDKLFFTAGTAEVGAELWVTTKTIDDAHVVKDIVAGQGSSSPTFLTAAGDSLYFVVGSELWKSDGTEEGTVRVLQIPGQVLSRLVVAEDVMYLLVKDSDPARHELWAADLTSASLEKIWAVNAFWTDEPIRELTALKNSLFFTVDDGVHGNELWQSGGTVDSTHLVADLAPGSASSTPNKLVVWNERVYLNAETDLGRELWSTDGSETGTRMVKDIKLVTGSHPFLESDDGRQVHVRTSDGFWQTDGTVAGTKPLMAGPSFPESVNARPLAQVGMTQYYWAMDQRLTLWKAEPGSPAQVVKANLAAATFNSLETFPAGVAVGNMLIFIFAQPNGQVALWRSDGTEAGTQAIKTFSLRDFRGGIAALDNYAIFAGSDATSGTELWRTDGTPEGTLRLKDIVPGIKSSTPFQFLSFRNQVFFLANGSLWRTDGGDGGTIELGKAAAGIIKAVPSENVVVFTGIDDSHGNELWKTDGTLAGTTMVKDFAPGPQGSFFRNFFSIDDKLLVQLGTQLWASDLTEKGTTMVPNSGWVNLPQYLTEFQGHIYFLASDKDSQVLWSTDGKTSERIIDSEFGLANLRQLRAVGNSLFFAAESLGVGPELYVIRAAIPGDLDGDGDVDAVDLVNLVAGWTGVLDPDTGGKDASTGDLDGDADVDSADLLTFLANWTGAQNAERISRMAAAAPVKTVASGGIDEMEVTPVASPAFSTNDERLMPASVDAALMVRGNRWGKMR